jgi:ribonuclease PH
MGTPNACHDRDIAMRLVDSDDRQIDVTIGLVCNNVGFLVEGDSEGKYLNEEELQRLADLAHEAVPEIDADQARD